MKRSAIAVAVAVAMALMSVPGTVMAHESTATDLNDAAYDEVWPLVGPGGATDDPTVKEGLSTLGLDAEESGGALDTTSCTHHADGIKDINEPYNPGDECNVDGDDDNGAVHEMKFYQCNGAKSWTQPTTESDIQIETDFSFNHSDLENGIFEATGSFFVPIELDGPTEQVDQAAQVHFGFLHTFAWPMSSALCQDPFPLSGAYYEFYRADTTPEDGWEIPVNTLLVPDAPYGAILRVMDDQANTLAAAFVYANVNNYLNDANSQSGTPESCDQSSSTGETLCQYHDTTPPHATVFDKDEEPSAFPRSDKCTKGIALEYGEPLATDDNGDPAVEIEPVGNSDGDLTVTPYQPPGRDVDSLALFTVNTEQWGPGICIEEPPAEFNAKAWDQSGNVGVQTVVD
jgi:hypothetical protein